MEIKKSTVKQVQSNGTWENKFGVMYKYEVEMTNGDAGQYLSKSDSQDKFKQGMVVDYEYTAGDFPKIKPHFAQGYDKKFGDGGTSYNPKTGTTSKTRTGEVIGTNDKMTKQDWAKKDEAKEVSIVRQSSLKAAVEFCDKHCSIEDIIDNAEVFYKWVRTGEKPTISNEKPF